MSFYKNENNVPYFFDAADSAETVARYVEKFGLTEITEEEFAALTAPAPISELTHSELRAAAYTAESDPLKTQIENEALFDGVEPDYAPWIEKVAEIKARYPKPE